MRRDLPAKPPPSVDVSREYRVTPEAAFEAWSEPAFLEKWFGPPGFAATIERHEFWVGGRWRFLMKGDDDDTLVHFGTFVTIDRPRTLAFTWASGAPLESWRGADGEPTLVTVGFHPTDEGVRVSITHQGLVLEDARKGLSFGWGGGLASLGQHLGDKENTP